jgi:hypothetical protein
MTNDLKSNSNNDVEKFVTTSGLLSSFFKYAITTVRNRGAKGFIENSGIQRISSIDNVPLLSLSNDINR